MKFKSIFVPKDQNGNMVHAHGGQVIKDNGIWYWFGEVQRYMNWFFGGISCYSSRDLIAWKYEGITVQPTESGYLSRETVAYRPKVLFNNITRKYVMFIAGCNEDCSDGYMNFLISDTITGTYKLVNTCRGFGGRRTMDHTVFKDDDGQAYALYSANTDRTGHWIDKLSDDYLSIVANVSHPSEFAREAPCILKKDGRYYLYFSECTGWKPNQGRYVTATSLAGPWTEERVFGDSTTYDSQGYCFFTIDTKSGSLNIYAADMWDNSGALGPVDPCDFNKARYMWLPMRVEGDTLSVDYVDSWELELE